MSDSRERAWQDRAGVGSASAYRAGLRGRACPNSEFLAVLAVDEKSQMQALDRTAPARPMMPGSPNAAPTTTPATAPGIPAVPQHQTWLAAYPRCHLHFTSTAWHEIAESSRVLEGILKPE
jgi:hypothetical protein